MNEATVTTVASQSFVGDVLSPGRYPETQVSREWSQFQQSYLNIEKESVAKFSEVTRSI